MEETPLERIIHLVVFLAICGGILFLGWNEPLSYRFMSPQEIANAEGRNTPQPTPSWIHNSPRRSMLDEPAKPAGVRRVPGGGGIMPQ